MRHLLNLFFNHLFFGSMMMFGSSAFGGGMGGDGGEGSGDSGSGGGLGASDDGTGGEISDSDDGGAGYDNRDTAKVDGNGDNSAVDDPNATVDLGDGRQVPAKWKKLFDTAKEQGLDKEVKQLFFGMQRLSQRFPGGINEAVKLAQSVQEHGGLEAITQLKTDLETYQQDSEVFAKDPAKWIEAGFSENPEASLKAFTHSLDYVGEKFPEQYDHLMAKVIISDMAALPIHDIYEALAALKDDPKAQGLAGKLAEFYNQRLKLSQKVPEKKVDAERAKLDSERTKLQSEQENLRNHTVNSQTIPRLGRQMTTHLEKEAKTAGFDLKKFSNEQPGAWQAMRRDILDKVMSKAASDQTFCRNYKSVLQSGDTKRAAAMMDKKHDTILPAIVTEVARLYGVNKKAATKGNNNGNNRQAGNGNNNSNNSSMLRVNAKPPSNEIDWSKTGTKIYDAVAVLKNGKTVTWA